MRGVLFLLAVLLAAPAHAGGLLGGLALEGHDPVIYVEYGTAVKGFRQHVATSDGMAYYFRAPENVEIFLADKAKYTPQFGGHCAYQAAKGRIIAGNPKLWVIEGGKLYFFRSDDSRDAWYLMMRENIIQGAATWAAYKGENADDTTLH
jgi:YHS domain-containing protein